MTLSDIVKSEQERFEKDTGFNIAMERYTADYSTEEADKKVQALLDLLATSIRESVKKVLEEVIDPIGSHGYVTHYDNITRKINEILNDTKH